MSWEVRIRAPTFQIKPGQNLYKNTWTPRKRRITAQGKHLMSPVANASRSIFIGMSCQAEVEETVI